LSKKKKSVIPIYGVAIVWVLYCAIFPLHMTWHFIVLPCSAVFVYVLLSIIFPGKTEFIELTEEPERTGDEKIDELLAEGENITEEMRAISRLITDSAVSQKIDFLVTVTDKIFKDLLDDAGDYKKIKRFSELYLPTTIKLLNTYVKLSQSGVRGDSLTGTQDRIDLALDTIIISYEKFFDSLFEDQALDIETDIQVLEIMLKNEGLLEREF